MKHNFLTILAVLALAPRASFAHQVGAISLPSININAIMPASIELPARRTILPNAFPTLPNRIIPGPFENNKPMIKFPEIERPMPIEPALPFPIRVQSAPKLLAQAAASDKGVKAAQLDKTYDNNARAQDNDDVVFVVEPRKQERKPSRMTLPESDLAAEIGIIDLE